MTIEIERLEQDLATLGRASQYPPTPDLVATFWRGVASSPASREPQRRRLWLGASAAAIAVVALVFTLAAPARDAAADLFSRIDIFSTDEGLEGLPAAVDGEPTTVEAAEVALGRPIEQPTYPADITPESVVLQDFGPVKAVAIGYDPPDGAPFTLFVTNAHVGKGVVADSGVSAEPVSWPGAPRAFWFDGPHRVEFRVFDGKVIEESVRQTPENTLVWERDGFVYRLEGDLEQDKAVRIAQSLE